MEYPWAREIMQKINELTPDIKGKAFDPDWFLLRQNFEQAEEKLFSQGIEWGGKQWDHPAVGRKDQANEPWHETQERLTDRK